MPWALTDEQCLIETQSIDVADPINVGDEQRFTVGDYSVVDGVPITAQLSSDLVDRSTQTTYLNRCPPPSRVGQRSPRPRYSLIENRPRTRRAARLSG